MVPAVADLHSTAERHALPLTSVAVVGHRDLLAEFDTGLSGIRGGAYHSVTERMLDSTATPHSNNEAPSSLLQPERHRPVVDQMDLHVGAEDASGDVRMSIAGEGKQMIEQAAAVVG